MIGAIIGDIVGSRFEFHNHKSKNPMDFELFAGNCSITDDSVMSLAVAQAIMLSQDEKTELDQTAIRMMQKIGRNYPNCGYGGNFYFWIFSENPLPYESFGNGSAMRVSPCGYAAQDLQEALEMSDAVTCVSHNHVEGLRGARAIADAIYQARIGKSKQEIRERICQNYYALDFTIDEIWEQYDFDVTCQGTVPQALELFLESDSFEETLRRAICLGGDSDTLAAIACSVAEAYYGVPRKIYDQAVSYLDEDLQKILFAFEERYGVKIIEEE